MARQSFSERMGLTPAKAIQTKGIDAELRNGLWNVLLKFRTRLMPEFREYAFRTALWEGFLKLAADQMPEDVYIQDEKFKFWGRIRSWFFNDSRHWFELYDFMQFVGEQECSYGLQEFFADEVNVILEREKSGYRYIGGEFVPLTNETELATIETALTPVSAVLSVVQTHFKRALSLLADKTSPDYANSIKESISGVEALCKKISGMESATFTPALEKTVKELGINGDLREGYRSIFKYTSDDQGIRHARKNDNDAELEDAMFMLVTCSAFSNFIIEKARKQNKLPT